MTVNAVSRYLSCYWHVTIADSVSAQLSGTQRLVSGHAHLICRLYCLRCGDARQDRSGYNRSYAPAKSALIRGTGMHRPRRARSMIRLANGPRRTSISRFNSSG
jgi:hypothetical protein